MTESRVIPMKQTWIDVRGAQVPWPAERLTANCWKQRVVRVAVRLSIKMHPRSYFLCSWSSCSQWLAGCVQAALSVVSSVKIAVHLPQPLFEVPLLWRATRSQSLLDCVSWVWAREPVHIYEWEHNHEQKKHVLSQGT